MVKNEKIQSDLTVDESCKTPVESFVNPENNLHSYVQNLNERVKELNCLYKISNIMNNNASLEETFQKIVDVIPSAWQYPEITCVRITFNDWTFQTDNFRETPWKQASETIVYGKQVADLEIYYLEEKPEIDEGPFLKEERSLINTLSEQLQRTIERKEDEKKLLESEIKYSNLVENGNDGIIILQDSVLKFANKKVIVSGYSIDEVIGKPFVDFVSPGFIDLIKDRYKRRFSGKNVPNNYEIEIISKDGKKIPVEINASIIEYEGRPADMAILRDITEREQAENLLRQSEDKFRTIFESANDEIYIVDLKANILEVNQKACNNLGYSRDELLRMTIKEISTKKQLSKFPGLIEAVLQKESVLFETVHFRKDGVIYPVELNIRLIDYNEDKVMLVVSRDITERKQAEDALRESEEKLRNIVENSTNLFYSHTPEHDLTYLSPQSHQFLQCEPEEAMVRWSEFATDNPVNEEGFALTEKAINTGKRQPSYKLELVGKKGRKIWVEVNENPLVKDGNTMAIVGSLTDITERRQAEVALQKSEEKYRNLVDTIDDLIFRVDPETLAATYVNSSIERIYGYSVEEWLNDPDLWSNTIYPEDREEVFAKATELQTTLESGSLEYRIIKKDKTIRWVKENVSWEIDKQGKPISMNGIIYDITERKQAEDAMINAKLLAEDANKAKSNFIANMSHELRTPLNSIIGFSDVIYNENYGSLNEYQKKYMSNVLRNGKNLLNLINNIISISNIENRKMEIHIDKFLVSDTIDQVEALMLPLASQKYIDLTCSVNIEAPIIKADATKFKQILYNLISNAIKFTDKGGSVTIGGKISEHIVHISVEDSGIGISPEDQDKLFNPFFQVDSSSTREYGGAGLGLALVKKFVEMHNGQIWVDSEVGKGSTFTFIIPTAFENKSF